MGAEGDGEGREEARYVIEHQARHVGAGGGEGVEVYVRRAGNDGDEHGHTRAVLAQGLDRDEAEHDVAYRVHRADVADHAEVPAAVFGQRGEEYAEGGAGSEVHEHDEECAYRCLISKEFSALFQSISSSVALSL